MTTVPIIMEMCNTSLNDGTTEQPVSRFCYSNCNRFGLLVLALFKLVLSVVLIVALISSMLACLMFGPPPTTYHVVFLLSIQSAAIFLDIVDILFVVITIISIYVNNERIMKTYYLYSIYIFGCITILCCYAFYIISGYISSMLKLLFIFLLILVMQMCLNYMLKKEVQMLRSNASIPL